MSPASRHTVRRGTDWLRWGLAVAILAWIVVQNRDQLSDLGARRPSLPLLGVALLVCAASLFVTFARWHLLVRAQQIPMRFAEALRLGAYGFLSNYVAPGAAGGDIVRAVLIVRHQPSRQSAAIATVVLDRLLGLLGMILIGAVASLFLSRTFLQHPTILATVITLWGGCLAGMAALVVGLFLLPPLRVKGPESPSKIRSLFNSLADSVVLFQSARRAVFATLLLSMLSHFGLLSCFCLCTLALGQGATSPGYWEHLLLVPAAQLVSTVVPTPGGVGALEGAVQYAYSAANQASGALVDNSAAETSGLCTAAGFRLLSLLVALGASAGFFIAGQFGRRDENEEQSILHMKDGHGEVDEIDRTSIRRAA